ncbi:MAG TPA: hypothetical protein DEB39_11005 [Planctomycetaceae bacterium]|nr:hypothetical protein [Planctomycetaceae bacterium]
MTKAELRYLVSEVAKEVKEEIEVGEDRFGAFHSLHEALAILREEYMETEAAIFWEAQKKGDVNLIRKEAIQVAAVAVRLAVMLTPTDRAMRKEIDALENAERQVD